MAQTSSFDGRESGRCRSTAILAVPDTPTGRDARATAMPRGDMKCNNRGQVSGNSRNRGVTARDPSLTLRMTGPHPSPVPMNWIGTPSPGGRGLGSTAWRYEIAATYVTGGTPVLRHTPTSHGREKKCRPKGRRYEGPLRHLGQRQISPCTTLTRTVMLKGYHNS